MVATLAKNNLRDDEEYITLFGIKTCDDNDFDEDKHPRKKNGQFAKTKGSKESKENKKRTEKEENNTNEININKKHEQSFNNKKSNKSEESKPKETKMENTENEESKEESVKNKIKNMSATCKKWDDVCKNANIKYREVKKLNKQLSTDEIVKKIGGADKTKGSCASVAFAYIANKHGLDVNDFRGGKSLEVFCKKDFLSDMIHTNNYKNFTIESNEEIESAKNIIDKFENDKEYLCSFGIHNAIIKKTKDDIKYLELQDEKSGNGWKSFYEWDNTKYSDIDKVLKKRFGAIKKSKYICKAMAVEVDSFKDNIEFQHLLGYTNTAKEKQKKQEVLFHTNNKIDYKNLFGPDSGITFI